MSQGIAVINNDSVVPRHSGPPGHAGQNGFVIANLSLTLNPAVKERTNNAFMDKSVTHGQLAFGGELRHTG